MVTEAKLYGCCHKSPGMLDAAGRPPAEPLPKPGSRQNLPSSPSRSSASSPGSPGPGQPQVHTDPSTGLHSALDPCSSRCGRSPCPVSTMPFHHGVPLGQLTMD